MKLAWHIFRKDTRRLWWEVAVALGAMASLAYMDAQRSDFVPGATEGLMHVLVPAIWCYVVAMAVHQEPLVGDTAFWLSRPYPRGALAAAKALFVVVWLHIPSLALGASVVAARGFQPLHFVDTLLSREAAFAACLTLPAAAVAAFTRSLPQFGAWALAITGSVALLADNWIAPRSPWVSAERARDALTLSAIAAGSVLVLYVQYRYRRVSLARVSAVVLGVGAGAIFVYLPPDLSFMLGNLWRGTPSRSLHMQLAPGQPQPDVQEGPERGRAVIPVEVSGLRAGERLIPILPESLEIEGGGQHWSASWPMRYPTNAGSPPHVFGGVVDRERLMLTMDPRIARTLRTTPVNIRGRFRGWVAAGATSMITTDASARSAAGVGLCSTAKAQDYGNRELLKVMCEYPGSVPLTRTVLRSSDGREWMHRLGDSMPGMHYPYRAWMSPVDRRQTFFHIVEQDVVDEPGGQWLVPRAALSGASLMITPDKVVAYADFRYELRGVNLAASGSPAGQR